MRVDSKTVIEKSEKNCFIKDEEESTSLEELGSIQPFTKINCKGKVICVDAATTTGNRKAIQNALIADRTGSTRITLWEDDINKLVANKS